MADETNDTPNSNDENPNSSSQGGSPSSDPAKGKSELEEAQAKLATYEKANRERKEAEAAKAGEWEKVIESKDAEIAKINAKLAKKDEAIRGFENTSAERSILEGIGAKAKGADPAMLRAAYRDLVQSKGLDIAPKDLESAVKERAGLLEKTFPSLFAEGDDKAPSGGGGSPPKPGKSKTKERRFRGI